MRDGENGLLVDIGDSAALADRFERILRQPALAKTLVSGGEKTLMSLFSEESVANAYLRLFASRQVSSAKRARAA
jgi:glycosyltransferase involved in cell wall biosynthesis